MIKVIAFDLVGVLVKENDFKLNSKEAKIEKMFGSNINDADFLIEARKIIPNDALLIRTTEYIINNIYNIRENNIFKNIKDKYNGIKIVIATNHVSYIRNFIGETFGIDYLDDVLISAEIHKIKPNFDFYKHILNKFDIKPQELLFLDDNQKNIDVAKNLNINTIKVNSNTKLYESVIEFLYNIN